MPDEDQAGADSALGGPTPLHPATASAWERHLRSHGGRRMARDFAEEWRAFLRDECATLIEAGETADRLEAAARHAYYAGYTLARRVR